VVDLRDRDPRPCAHLSLPVSFSAPARLDVPLSHVGRPVPADVCPRLGGPPRAHGDAAPGCLEIAPVSPICHGLSRGPISPMRHGMSSCHVPSFLEPCPVISTMLCIYFYYDVIFAIRPKFFFFFFFFLLLQFTSFFLARISIFIFFSFIY
jgi:hypothetical protein